MNNITTLPHGRQLSDYRIKRPRSRPDASITAGAPKLKQKPKAAESVDDREQLVNNCDTGPAEHIAIPEKMVTSLHGILLDVDPARLNRKKIPKEARKKPTLLDKCVYRPILQRHPVLAKAEVRNSGTGLHIILRFDKPVVFEHYGDRQRWAAIIKIIQRLLPTDPNAPGITAFTRPIGSINSKNNQPVKLLNKGRPVTADEVVTLAQQVTAAPFRTVMSVVFGTEKKSPCPFCKTGGTSLAGFDKSGKCYRCGSKKLGQLFDLFLKEKPE